MIAAVLVVAACDGGAVDLSTTTVPSGTETTEDSTSGGEPPRIVSLSVDGAVVGPQDGVFMLPEQVNPGDLLQFEAVIADNKSGVLTILDTEVVYESTTGSSSVSLDVTVPPDLRSTEIPVLLNGEEMGLARFQPSEQWSPIATVANPTGLTGEATIEVEVFDLNGADTVETLSVIQEFNFQHADHADMLTAQYGLTPLNIERLEDGPTYVGFEDTRYDFLYTAEKTIVEYVSTGSLAPIEVATTTPGRYQIHLTSQWPGRFPLHLTATDTAGNSTTTRIPIEIYWAEQPFDIRGVMIDGWTPVEPANLSSEDFEGVLDQLADANFSYVSLNPMYYLFDQSDADFKRSPPRWKDGIPTMGLTDEQIGYLIDGAHGRGMGVMLKPMIFLSDWSWVGDIDPADPAGWFAKYMEQVLLPTALLAAENDVEILSLYNDFSEQNQYRTLWEDAIDQVRAVYGGQITIAHPHFPDLYRTQNPPTILGSIDLLGFQNYLPGTGYPGFPAISGKTDPTVFEMEENILAHLEGSHATAVRPSEMSAVATEMGLLNFDEANLFPANIAFQEESRTTDNQEHIDYHEAMLRAMAMTPWVEGFFSWSVMPYGEVFYHDGTHTNDPRELPTLDLLRIWNYDARRSS